MALKNYKINEVIKVEYQASGAGTGLAVNMKVYDELDAEDVGQAAVMTEKSTSGRYKATFTPDAEGEWSVHISDSAGGKAVKQFSVGNYNVDSVGAKIVTVEGKVDIIDGKIDAIDTELDSFASPSMIG